MQSIKYLALAMVLMLAPMAGKAQAAALSGGIGSGGSSVTLARGYSDDGRGWDRGDWRDNRRAYRDECRRVRDVTRVRGRLAEVVSTVCRDRRGRSYTLAGSTHIVRYIHRGHDRGWAYR